MNGRQICSKQFLQNDRTMGPYAALLRLHPPQLLNRLLNRCPSTRALGMRMRCGPWGPKLPCLPEGGFPSGLLVHRPRIIANVHSLEWSRCILSEFLGQFVCQISRSTITGAWSDTTSPPSLMISVDFISGLAALFARM